MKKIKIKIRIKIRRGCPKTGMGPTTERDCISPPPSSMIKGF
jgi:hypothetical protein